MSEEHKAIIEQELMRNVVVQILRNQELILTTCYSKGIDDIIEDAIEVTQELIGELED